MWEMSGLPDSRVGRGKPRSRTNLVSLENRGPLSCFSGMSRFSIHVIDDTTSEMQGVVGGLWGKREKLKLGLGWVNEFIAYFSCVEMFLFCFVTETQENVQNVNLQS